MKILSIDIENVGLIEKEHIDVNKPLLMFYGGVTQGKSTILNAVRWCLGSEWPADIIRHGQKDARVLITFDRGTITRSWYVSPKDGTTKARDIVYVLDGHQVARPAKEIAKLLNPFTTNQDYLRSMTEPERKAFFAQVLAVDSNELDAEAAACAGQAVQLRAEVKAYGEFPDTITIPPTAPPDVAGLEAELDMVKAEFAETQSSYDEAWQARSSRSLSIQTRQDRRKMTAARLEELKDELEQLQDIDNHDRQWLDNNPALPEPTKPEPPARIQEIELSLRSAGEVKAKYEQWQRDLARFNQKQIAAAGLTKLEARQRAIKEEKAKKLKDYAADCGVPGLSFDESGQVVFENTTAGMLSTSQLMRLSAALAALYPPGLNVDLIDRAESLGRSIYTLIDDAKARERTILATVVGDAPAQSPPEVGVFIVEAGKIKKP